MSYLTKFNKLITENKESEALELWNTLKKAEKQHIIQTFPRSTKLLIDWLLKIESFWEDSDKKHEKLRQ